MSKQDVSNLLVFGSGRLGSAIKLKFPEVTLISKEQCDITRREDVDNIIREYTPEVIINTSAITDLTLCESNSRLAWDVNVYGARNISFVSNKYKIYSVQISSNNAINPVNEYGFTKQACEGLLFSLIVRIDYFDKDHWLIKKILDNSGCSLLSTNQFNPVYIDTLVNVLITAINQRISGEVNIGSNRPISYYDFGTILSNKLNIIGNNISKIQSINLPYSYDYDAFLDCSSMRRICNLSLDIEGEISKYVNFIKKQKDINN